MIQLKHRETGVVVGTESETEAEMYQLSGWRRFTDEEYDALADEIAAADAAPATEAPTDAQSPASQDPPVPSRPSRGQRTAAVVVEGVPVPSKDTTESTS